MSFLNQMGESGNRHIRITMNATRKEMITNVHDIGWSYVQL